MNARRTCRGATLIWVVVFGMFLIMLVGVAIDIGYVYHVAQQLQSAADAAALAGAQRVKTDLDATRQAAIDVALANEAAAAPVRLADNPGNAPGGDIVVGRFSLDTGVFDPDDRNPNAVKVLARRTAGSPGGGVPLFFGRLFGYGTTNVSRSAIAIATGGTGAGLIALNPHAPSALNVVGSGTLTVNGGDIQVNSDSNRAVTLTGSASIHAPEVDVVGDVRIVGSGRISDDLNTGASPISDPLAALPPPTWNPARDLGTVRVTGSGTRDLVPGYYSGGISITDSGRVNLAPGIYVLDGAGLDVAGSGRIVGTEVMIYLTGRGALSLTGSGTVQITSPQASSGFSGAATYDGIAIFQDPANDENAAITGSQNLHLEGTVYLPGARLTITGSGDGFGNQLIADTIEVSGSGTITIEYDGRFAAAGFHTYLVR
jgi:hypothetical protein